MDKVGERTLVSPTLSVILPIYNQSRDIGLIMMEYPERLDALNISWELLFIVNGSYDESYAKARDYAKDLPNVHAYNLDEPGWGRAVKFGISKSTGQYVCYTNSARTDTNDLVLILKYALVHDGVLIKANRITRESLTRKLGSTIYNIEFRLLFRIPVWDVNATPKVVAAKTIRELDLQEDGDLIDAELILKCMKMNRRFIEVPVVNTRRFHGKSTTNLISAIKMYFGLFLLKKKV
jgi:undecaprenyl-phosphate 4-deoxy-4-formamido-L-arabinose transferase